MYSARSSSSNVMPPFFGSDARGSAEGVAADKSGVIYGAEVGQKDLKRYLKKR